MQQPNHRADPGARRMSSAVFVVGATPVMRRRWPRPEASSSTASLIREAPPVSATIPSAAARSSGGASLATCNANQRNPPASIVSAASGAAQRYVATRRRSPSSFRSQPPRCAASIGWSSTLMIYSEHCQFRRQRGSPKLLDVSQRMDNDLPRSERRHGGDQSHFGGDHGVACETHGEVAQHRGSFRLRGAHKQAADAFCEDQEQQGRDASEGAPFEAQPQEMALELGRDIGLLGADEMQHLYDR